MKYIVPFLFLLFLLAPVQAATAQTPIQQTLQRAEKHIKDAEQYYAEMKYTKAKESYQFAARLYRNNNLPEYYAICYNGIGNIYIDLTRYEEAKSKGFEKALQQLQEIKSIDASFEIDSSLIADAYEGLGRYYSSIVTLLATDSGQVIKVNYNKALEYHLQALHIRQRLHQGAHQKIALSYYYIGQCYRGFSTGNATNISEVNPIKEELRYLQRALNMQLKTVGGLHYQTANTYQALGNYFYETQQDYHQGYAYHQEAFDIRQQLFEDNHPQIAASYINLATYYRVMNIYDLELNYLEMALQIQLGILGTEHAEIAKSYYLLANRYRSNGALEKALSYYSHVLYIFEKLGQPVNTEVANTHLAMAACYTQLHRKARVWQELEYSQQLFERVYGSQHFQLSKVLLAKGDYYLAQNQYDSSAHFYQKALQLNQEQLGQQHYAVAKVYDKFAHLYQQIGQGDQERKYLLLALAIRKVEAYLLKLGKKNKHASYLDVEEKNTSNSSLSQQLHNSYKDLAGFHERQQDYVVALQYIQLALAAVCKSLEPYKNDWKYNPTIEDLSSNVAWLSTLSCKADLLMALYQNKQEETLLGLAHETYKQGIQVINGLRTRFQSTKAKQELRSYSVPIFEGAIRCLYAYQSQQPNKSHLAEAFEVAELSKNFVLLQGLQNNLARGSSNIPNSLLERERDLRQQLAYYSNYNNRGQQNNQQYDQAYLRTKQQYDSLIQQLEQHYPRYYDLKYQTTVTTLKEVQQNLTLGKQVLLEYFVGMRHLYVFRITGDQCKLFQMEIPNNYEKLVYNLRSALTNYDMIAEHPQWAYQAFIVASYRFHSYFLAPFLPNDYEAEQLIVIADGMLHYIPFEVALWEVPENDILERSNYKDLSFLIKRFPISYNYSATLWNRNLQRKTLKNNGQCLGLAPSIQFSEKHDSLPWTQKELEAIQRIYKGDYYYGEQANKALFQQQANQYNIIHLATHGIVNMQNPMRSMLSFGAGDQEESSLYAYEIHNLSLQANLVVLSACETGFGKTVQGEGVSSLARAFLFAGTPSVMTTLWEVNDFTSAALIELFYNNLSQGMNKAEALQAAKLAFLSKTDEISGHPTYWASFITLGDASPLPNSWNGGWWLLGISVVLLFLVGLVVYIKKTISPK
ncbi:MAG: CHAT domain-containing protein [Aureispira sp.]